MLDMRWLAEVIRTDPEVRDAIQLLVEEHIHMTGIHMNMETGEQRQTVSVEWNGAN